MPSFNGIAYPVAGTQMGLALETTRGTAVAPTVWIPVKAPKYKPNLSLIADETLQGSMVQIYDLVTGIRYDGHGWSAPPYMDSFPFMLAAEFGSPDMMIAKPTGTITTSANWAAGATTGTFVGATGLAVGQYFTVGSASLGTLETHRLASGSGAGPWTFSEPMINAVPSGSSVTFLTTHRFSVVNNNQAEGNQPPSVTITDFDGQEWRQLTACQLDELTIKGNGTSLVEYTCTWMGNPASTPSLIATVTAASSPSGGPYTLTVSGSPAITSGMYVAGPGITGAVTTSAPVAGVVTLTAGSGSILTGGLDPTGQYIFTGGNFVSSFGTVQTPAPWSFYSLIGGTYTPTVMDYEFSFKRGVKPIPALTGQQQYFTYFAGPLQATGKLTFIEQSGSPELTAFLNAVRQSFDFTLFDQKGGTALNIHASNGQFKTGEIDRSKEYVTVTVEFDLLPSATDALAGGVSPCIVSVANTQTTSYYGV